jgi:hypothetical protein
MGGGEGEGGGDREGSGGGVAESTNAFLCTGGGYNVGTLYGAVDF